MRWLWLLFAFAACGDGGTQQIPTLPPDGGGEGGDAGLDARPDGPDAVIVKAGAKNRIVLIGTILTPDEILEGQIKIEDDKITCVAQTCDAGDATVIDTRGIIVPGMMDLHNHILFDVFDEDDWLPTRTYEHHDEWADARNEPGYALVLDAKQCLADDSQGKPSWCPPKYDGAGSLRCEMQKWGELKGIVAGTTSIVTLAGTSNACFSSVARSIDMNRTHNSLPVDHVQATAATVPSNPNGVCANFTAGTTKSFIVHNGEGTNPGALGEFETLRTSTTTQGCLFAPQTAITHATAYRAQEFQTMAQAKMKLVWSPRSNVTLYGKTTDIPAALQAGVMIALGPDWSLGGSQNLLDEMRFADDIDNKSFGDKLTPKDIVLMATKNGAIATAFDDRLGALKVGYLADIAVLGGDRSKPYDAIVSASAKHVRMTIVGGRILYGDDQLKGAANDSPGCEDIDICGRAKFVCVAETTQANKLNQTYAQIKSALDTAMADVDAAQPTKKLSPLAPLAKCK